MEAKLLPMKPIIDDSGEVVRLTREVPPIHCILKVDSFPVLQDELSGPRNNCFESTEFKAGGYTWVMSVYPNGSEKEQSGGYLSLYVSLIDKVNPGDVVQAQLRFLVYDQIRDNYLCVQYVRDKRFYGVKNTWGIPQFLSLSTIYDASNGFLVDNHCVFGAEVLVPDGFVRVPSLSIVKKCCNRAFTWRIENFSELIEPLDSPKFCFDGRIWTLKLHPNGAGEGKGNSLSLFLKLQNCCDLISGSKLYAKYILSIKNQDNGRADYNETVSHWFTSQSPSWGDYKYILLDELYTQKCLLVEDTLVVEVRMEVMFLLKDVESYNEEQ